MTGSSRGTGPRATGFANFPLMRRAGACPPLCTTQRRPVATGRTRGTGPRATVFAEFFPSCVGGGLSPTVHDVTTAGCDRENARDRPSRYGFRRIFPSCVGWGPVPRCARRNGGRLRQGEREGQALALRTAGQFSPEIFDMNCENDV